jgi:hypothetical protein
MMDYKLPDGTWVTTPIGLAIGGQMTTQCANGCDWEDQGPPSDGPVPVQPQKCARCGWVRGKYLGNPYPEEGHAG